jgi:3-methyladenine DNA glycosylase AlkD
MHFTDFFTSRSHSLPGSANFVFSTMNLQELEAVLTEIADPRALANWQRLNFQSKDRYLGTGMSKLKDKAKKIQKDHSLAMQCWRSDLYDFKMMACFIDEPKKISPEEADDIIQNIDIWGLGDQYVKNQIVKTPFKVDKAEQWANDKREYARRAGYQLVQILAKEDDTLPDTWFESYLRHIENLQQESNFVKEMMAYALMSIGSRNPELHAQALQIAKKAGEIQVDYGDTSCQSPNPLSFLEAKTF